MATFFISLSYWFAFAYIFFRYRGLIDLVDGLGETVALSVKDFASEGGVARVAQKGEKILLGEMIRRVITDQTGGIADVALNFFPDLEEWIERNPYAVLRLFQNPQIQKIIKQFVGQLQQQQQTDQARGLDYG